MPNYVGNNQFTFNSMQERFWSKVFKRGKKDCWEWKAFINPGGYGTFKVGKRMIHAHRVSWMLSFGDIPNQLWVLHKCDNRSCVNPSHLFLGTNDDNMKDMVLKKRSTKGKAFVYGETHHLAILSQKDVKDIKRLYATGRYTYFDLAKKFGVVFQHIGSIIKGVRRQYD